MLEINLNGTGIPLQDRSLYPIIFAPQSFSNDFFYFEFWCYNICLILVNTHNIRTQQARCTRINLQQNCNNGIVEKTVGQSGSYHGGQ